MKPKLSHEKPPIYEVLHKKFGVEWDKGLIITYGNTIHCKNSISPDYWVHECVHVIQQGDDPQGWCERYIDDPDFRLKMEVEAYRAQVRYLNQNVVNWRKRVEKIEHLAKSLSGFVYGNLCSYDRAYELITSGNMV